jgi:hypothetical protein
MIEQFPRAYYETDEQCHRRELRDAENHVIELCEQLQVAVADLMARKELRRN